MQSQIMVLSARVQIPFTESALIFHHFFPLHVTYDWTWPFILFQTPFLSVAFVLYRVFQKELYNGAPNINVWRVL
jgi:hypothetical protein